MRESRSRPGGIAPRRWLALALAGSVLAGCASRPPPPAPVVVAPPPPVEVVPELTPMEFLRRTRAMSADELKAASERLAESPLPLERLQAALALAAPTHPARDEARARRIAEEVANGQAPLPVRDFAALFAERLAERAEAGEIRRRMEAKMRDDEKRVGDLEARIRDLERRATDAERRAGEAEKKLEALKQIDKALSDRPAPRPPAGNGTPR